MKNFKTVVQNSIVSETADLHSLTSYAEEEWGQAAADFLGQPVTNKELHHETETAS